jgi:putative transposase
MIEVVGEELDQLFKGTGRSSVSRRWKRGTGKATAELMARDLSGFDVAVVMTDGIEVAGQCA